MLICVFIREMRLFLRHRHQMSKYFHTQSHCLAVAYEPEGKKRICAFQSHMYVLFCKTIAENDS